MRLRKWAAVLIFTLLLALQGGAALAEPEQNPVSVKVTGALGNYSRQGAWLPLQVEVSNQGPDVSGKLVANFSSDGRTGPPYAVDYSVSAVAPQGSTKLFSLNVPVNEILSSVTVELVSAGKTVAKGKGEFSVISPGQKLIGLVDRGDAGFGALSQISASLATVASNLKSEDLPANPELLSLFDVLVLDDVNLKLNPAQGKALSGWVSNGGTLVVGGGPGWQKVMPKLPQELPAVEVKGMQKKDLGALAAALSTPVNSSPGTVDLALFESPGATVRFSAGGTPLVLERGYGSGKVVFLAFDPALEPMSGWKGSKQLWQDLLFPARSANANNFPSDKFAMMGAQEKNLWGLSNALSNIPSMQLPTIKNMFAVLAVYLFVAGILNYLILKKLDKREWTWVTLPLFSLLVVAVIYFTSFQSRPSEVIANQITVVEAGQNTPLVQLTTATGIFAPTYNTYRLELDGEYLVQALASPEGVVMMPNQKPEPTLEVEENPGKTVVDLKKMRSWVMRSFAAGGTADLAGSIDVGIIRRGEKWIAQISNNTQYDFTDGVVISNPFWFSKIDKLEAGGKTEAEIPLSSIGSSMMGGRPLSWQIYGNFKGGPVPGQPPDAKDMLRQQIMDYLFNQPIVMNANGRTAQTNQAMFIGWSDQPVKGALTLPDKSIKQYYTSVFKVPVKVNFDISNLEVPPGIINGSIIDSKNVGFNGGTGSVYLQPNSEVEYRFDLPAGSPAGMEVDLKFNGPPKASSASAAWSTVLYNWQKGAWEEVMLDSGTAQVKDYAKYISKDRQVRLKVENQQGGFEIAGVSIALSAKGGGTK